MAPPPDCKADAVVVTTVPLTDATEPVADTGTPLIPCVVIIRCLG